MEREIILFDKINKYKSLYNIFKSFKKEKIIEIFDSYSDLEILNFNMLQIAHIVQTYIKKEQEKYGIQKYATNTYEFYKIRGYIDNEIKEILNKRNTNNHSPYKKETYINIGYSESEAIFLVKSKRAINKEYWIKKGYTEEEAIKKVSEIQIKNSLKYKEKRKNNPQKYIGVNTNQKEYWIKKGYTEEEAIKKVSERQSTFTLEKCIKKYGTIKGTEIYNNRQKNWKLKIQKHFNTYGDGRSAQSKWAINIIDKLYESIGIDKPKREKYITDKKTKKHYSYDFCYKKKIIEFNGDYWHCNPLSWDANSYNSSLGMTAKEKWEKDKIKIDCAKQNNYDILIIWESEYYKNPQKCIDTCIKFIKDED